MNNIYTEKAIWNMVKNMVIEYFNETGNRNDGFFNDMFFEGSPYIIKLDDISIGFFLLVMPGKVVICFVHFILNLL